MGRFTNNHNSDPWQRTRFFQKVPKSNIYANAILLFLLPLLHSITVSLQSSVSFGFPFSLLSAKRYDHLIICSSSLTRHNHYCKLEVNCFVYMYMLFYVCFHVQFCAFFSFIISLFSSIFISTVDPVVV